MAAHSFGDLENWNAVTSGGDTDIKRHERDTVFGKKKRPKSLRFKAFQDRADRI